MNLLIKKIKLAVQEKLIKHRKRSPDTRSFVPWLYFSKSFIHLSSKHFMSTRCGSGMELGSEKTAVNRASMSPHAEVYIQ